MKKRVSVLSSVTKIHPMNRRTFYKLIGLGLLQWFLLNIGIFVVSLIYGIKESAEMTVPPPLGFVFVAAVMVVLSLVSGQWLKPTSRKQVVISGLLWSGMTILFMLVTVFMNNTQGVILGNWGVYTLFVAQVFGTLFVRTKMINNATPRPVV